MLEDDEETHRLSCGERNGERDDPTTESQAFRSFMLEPLAAPTIASWQRVDTNAAENVVLDISRTIESDIVLLIGSNDRLSHVCVVAHRDHTNRR